MSFDVSGRIYVVVRGGVVTDVLTNSNRLKPINVVVVDFDVEMGEATHYFNEDPCEAWERQLVRQEAHISLRKRKK